MKLSEKEAIVQKLQEGLASAQITIITDYEGLNVEKLSSLRRELREAGAEIHVVKNTLLRRASEGTSADLLREHFTGPSAICYSSTDPVLPAKVLTKFAEANEKLEIRAAVLEGKPLTVADLKALSELPSREELLAQVLSAMIAVPTGFVRVINAVPSGLVNVLTAIKDQKEAA
ncbi:50S ribosomal protein L10 [Desulfobotulus sp. H1]|uniref:Large ribosomal subunit protein uL10 n=1 Tax=Desulfobotulus pelophilus TaxID=2823377 RepID=A0ABT3N4R0_9BACT|nr:50S ribosomal protein L10 [Desulfobotulus pelophilus]MCW7752429.1 50S ribosomal protein L10 [Desulfobotulus pelophilus]